MNRFSKAKQNKDDEGAKPQKPMREYTDESLGTPPSMRFFRFEVTAYWLLPILIFSAILLGGIFIAFKAGVLSLGKDGADNSQPSYYNANGEILVPELLDTYLETVGGRDALEGVRSVRYKGRLIEDGSELELQILISSQKKGMIIVSPGKDYSQKIILNGDTAWQEVKLGGGKLKIVPLDEADTQSLAWSLRVNNTLRSLALGGEEARAGLTAREIEFQEKPCFELTKRRADGSQFLAVLDRKSLYLLEAEETVRHADGSEHLQTIYADYRTVFGIALAFETKTYKDGIFQNEIDLESIEVNPGLISSLFEIPEELRD